MTFKELALNAKKGSVAECLNILKEQQVAHYNEYLLFDVANLETTFFKNLEYLKDEEIWTKEQLAGYTVVAQTIDNDYILSNDNRVLVIPSNFYQQDSEVFDLSIWSFLEAFEEKTLTSQILALN